MYQMNVICSEKIGRIDPCIYGHFVEHIGGVVYDGIWVGENSSIDNIGGIRKDIITGLRHIHAPIIRWPGGCFAETYDWRDGIGPKNERPVTAPWWHVLDAKLESNHFGTHEFIKLCSFVGAEPYIAANATSVPALEIRNWIEYCNFPQGSTSLARLREQNGSSEPFGVMYWGIGNENWGFGGRYTPEDYCSEYRRFATIAGNIGREPSFDCFMPAVPTLSRNLYLVACGASGMDVEWTRRFFEKWEDSSVVSPAPINGYSLHYYCGTAGTALDFSKDQWYELLHKASRIEDIIIEHRNIMDSYDPERKIGLVIDEWGSWHPPNSGPSQGAYLFEQQSTVRDALVAATSLNIFNNHADKVKMANIAQLVNCLQSLFLAKENRFVTTPNYHVFDMYKGHHGAEAVRTEVEGESIAFCDGDTEQEVFGLSCSASIKNGRLTLSMANIRYADEVEVNVQLVGATGREITRKVTLSGDVPQACNDFDSPDRVKPRIESEPIPIGDTFHLRLPAASVVLLEVDLA